jgi:ATP-dependent Clp protease ATP-binding subunit ClpA
MFERYTVDARRAIFFARYEASQFGAPQIELEHLLLGLARIMNLPGDSLRAEIVQTLPRATPTSESVDLPVSHAVKRAMAFAAEEAQSLGHQHIVVEHLLLGLMRDERDSTVPGLLKKRGIDRESVLRDLTGTQADTPVDRESVKALVDSVPPDRLQGVKELLQSLVGADAIRLDITPFAPRAAPGPRNLKHSVKRAMAFAAEEAERLGHREVGVEHLLLGLMRDERESTIPDLLREHGIDREKVLGAVAQAPAEAPVDRESLKALVDILPPERLGQAKRMLESLQTRPPAQLAVPPRIAELRQEMRDRFRRGLKPGTAGGAGGGGSWNADEAGKIRRGRYSSSRFEDGADVVETHHFRDGEEITLVERFRLSEDGKTLSYTQEITGPGKSEQHTVDFEVSQEGGKNPG